MSLPLLSAKLVELRQQYGYSQQEVADYLGMTREGYCHYERNAREPGLEVLVKLCKLYPVDISELVNEELIPVSFADVELETASTLDKKSENSAVVISNMNHFLKLFTGKNISIDVSDISKEDIALLITYKNLCEESQRDVREFIEYKKYTERHKKE